MKSFNGYEVRMHIDDKGQPWWEASDVCKILDLDNVSQAMSRLEKEEWGYVSSSDDVGRRAEKICVNEPGLYALIFGSRKPEAKDFKKWVTGEVLPTIRQTGSYSTAPLSLSQQLLMSAQAMVEIERRQSESDAKIAAVQTDVRALESRTDAKIEAFEKKLIVEQVNQFPPDCETLEHITERCFAGITAAHVSTWLHHLAHPVRNYQYTDQAGQMFSKEVWLKAGLEQAADRLRMEAQITKRTPKNLICFHPRLGRFFVKTVSHKKNLLDSLES
jgi:prophage antirepressor-like protein